MSGTPGWRDWITELLPRDATPRGTADTGYKRKSGPPLRHVRSTPNSRHRDVRYGLSITGTETSDVRHMGKYRFEAITAIVGPWDTL